MKIFMGFLVSLSFLSNAAAETAYVERSRRQTYEEFKAELEARRAAYMPQFTADMQAWVAGFAQDHGGYHNFTIYRDAGGDLQVHFETGNGLACSAEYVENYFDCRDGARRAYTFKSKTVNPESRQANSGYGAKPARRR